VTELSRRSFLGTAGTLASLHVQTAATSPPAELTLTCANYVRFMPIAAGDVGVPGLSLNWIRGDRTEMLRRATADDQVDGGETSMAQHVMRLDGGDRSFVAVPVFPLRNFTARDLYMRKGATLTPQALAARRIGIYNWAASGAVWYRHLVRHFGHDVSKMTWIVGGVDAPAAVRLPQPPPAHVHAAPANTPLRDLLLRGDVDAIFSPLPPSGFDGNNGPIVRVVSDFRALEQQYFATTRCYPPQHVIVLRRTSWEKHRSYARRLVEAFNAADTQFEAAQRQFPYNSPWLIADVEDAVRVMGADYHAHGIEKNRHVVDTFCAAAFDDGLTKRRLTTKEFFAEFLET
jgi:4,5-dihydroxyphthalate decarboxylase